MFTDTLSLKYLLMTTLAVWAVVLIILARRPVPALLAGSTLFITIAYLALGTGFSIRLPYPHEKMEVIVHTIHSDRVHALARPLDRNDEPVHIVFSIDPKTPAGAQMRQSFFKAVRAHEEHPHGSRIIIDLRGHMSYLGEYTAGVPAGLPPKIPR